MRHRSALRLSAPLWILIAVACDRRVESSPEAPVDSTSPATSGAAPAVVWGEDIPAALQQAEQTGKLVLLNFTGTKWCQPCIRMEKHTFSTKEFAEYAEKKLVLVKVDFPDPVNFNPETIKIAEKYMGEIQLPTYVMLDAAGKRLGETSAQPDTKTFLGELDKLAAKASVAK